MGLATQSVELGAEHVARCHERRERLLLQHADLGACYDDLLREAVAGRRFWRVYRQFKMYNDPLLNPYLIRRGNGAA
jgi:hypothetical protein